MAPKKKSAGKTQGEIVDLESGTLIRDSFFIDLNKGASSGPGGNVLVVPEYSPGMFLKSPQVAVYGRRRKPLSQLPSNKQCDNTNIDCPVTYLSSGEDLPSTPDIRYAERISIPLLTVLSSKIQSLQVNHTRMLSRECLFTLMYRF